MQRARQRVVIIGGGFGGLRTALQLARYGVYDIVLVDKTQVHVYTPWLYEVASGRTDGMPRGERRALAHSAGIPFASILARHAVRFRHGEVVSIDVTARAVVCKDGGHLSYDALVLAPGGESAYFGIPGLREHAITLKTVEDAVRIHTSIAALKTRAEAGDDVYVVVIGGGPSGVELVGELAHAAHDTPRKRGAGRMHFSLVDGGSRVLGMCPPLVSRYAEMRLRALGVTLLPDTLVTNVTPRAVTLTPRTARPGDPGDVPHSPFARPTAQAYDCLVWCGGVAPSAFTKSLPFPKDARGRILVTPAYEVQGMINVFALGDAAACNDATLPTVPQTAQAADALSGTLAANVDRALRGRALHAYVPPRSWPFVTTVGGRFGVALFFGITVKGWVAYALRRGADLRYLLHILSPYAAYRVWRSRLRLYEEHK